MNPSWFEQLPPIDKTPVHDTHWEEVLRYGSALFDPKDDGFSDDLELLGEIPVRSSRQVTASPLGVGYEVLDHRQGYDFDKTLPIMEKSGVKWARLQSGWSRAEQTPGVYDFAWLDHMVDSLLAIGIQPWFSLSFGNGLYMDAQPLGPHRTYFYSPTRFGPACQQAWERYCQAMARHFQGRVRHWEVWNEPNAPNFFRDPRTGERDTPEEYAKLVAVTAQAIRPVQPEAKIIGGAISGGGLCNSYIQALFDAGMGEHIQIFSYHPYGAIPELYWPERLQYIRDCIARTGKDIAVWQGENGRPSGWNLTNKGWKYTEANQARFLVRRYLTDLRLGIPMTSYFQACDLGNGYNPVGKVYPQGVIDASNPQQYRPKLAFRAMQAMTALFDDQTQPMAANLEPMPYPGWSRLTLPLDQYLPLTCAFRKGNIPLYAYYHPTHIDADYMPHAVMVTLFVEKGLHFQTPVLLDPLTAKIYRIKRMPSYDDHAKTSGITVEFWRMPLLDYPLFLTDASLFPTLASPKA